MPCKLKPSRKESNFPYRVRSRRIFVGLLSSAAAEQFPWCEAILSTIVPEYPPSSALPLSANLLCNKPSIRVWDVRDPLLSLKMLWCLAVFEKFQYFKLACCRLISSNYVREQPADSLSLRWPSVFGSKDLERSRLGKEVGWVKK